MPKFDLNGDPRIDFFQWVNGSWLEANPIPAHKSRWGTFDVLDLETMEKVRALVEELQTKPDSELDIETRQVRDFYASGMDIDRRNEEGFTPIKELLDRVLCISSIQEAIEMLPDLHKIGVRPLWFADSRDDMKDNTRMVLWVMPSGFGLPDRDYYFDEDKAQIRKAYVAHIARMFCLVGWKQARAKAAAASIMEIETSLAQAKLTRAEARDPNKTYNPMLTTKLVELAPTVNWHAHFTSIGADSFDTVVVTQPVFIGRMNELLANLTPKQLGEYCAWTILNQTAPYLSESLDKEDFAFYGTVISGKQEIEPLWERVLVTTSQTFGEIIGRMYVERYFSEKAKARMREMIAQVVDVFAERIRNIDWLSQDSKAKALVKLSKITWKLGYPDVWRDYTKVGIQNDSFAANVMRGDRFIHQRELAKVGRPIDKNEWYMSADTVNAYAVQERLEMCYPAGILQPPFFDPETDDATNYGAIVAVIGHELTHISDDNGSKFDENGQLNDWWSEEDRVAFEKLVGAIREQYNAIEVLPKAFINGQLTLGENTADFGGISLAYEAMCRTYAGREHETIDGLTPAQRFFVSWARVWGANTREEELLRRLSTDTHSPTKQRCNVPLSNMPEFYAAFDVKEGDPMWRPPKARAKVW